MPKQEPETAVKLAPRGASIGWVTCAALVMANMIGTGVFTSLGFQVMEIQSGFVIVVLWVLGGLVALSGALSYAELAAALPRSGGEYHFLSRLYHPSLGFMAGLVSTTVGFAAPLALAAIAFDDYLSNLRAAEFPRLYAVGIITLVALAHLWTLAIGKLFQNIFTVFKVTLIIVFIAVGFTMAPGQEVRFAPAQGDLGLIFFPPFAVSLFFVMYSYSGWNAAVYILDEVRDPGKNVGRGLLAGTGLVMVLYVLMNAMMLCAAPIEEFARAAAAGNTDFAHIAARHIFGDEGGMIVSGLICIGLISTISAMTWAGPRVLQVMGEDYRALRFFAHKSSAGIPVRALLFQYVLSLLFLLPGFADTVVYAGFTLTICAMLTVAGLFVLRLRHPELVRPGKSWAFPVAPIFFLLVMLLMIIFAFPIQKTQFFAGILTLGVACALYFPMMRMSNREGSNE